MTVFTNASVAAVLRSFGADEVSPEVVTMYFVMISPVIYWAMVGVRGVQFGTLVELGYTVILGVMGYSHFLVRA